MRNWKRSLESTKDHFKAVSDSEVSLATMNSRLTLTVFFSFEETWNEIRKDACLTKKKRMILSYHENTIEATNDTDELRKHEMQSCDNRLDL